MNQSRVPSWSGTGRLFAKRDDVDEECDKINKAIRASRYDEFYAKLNAAVETEFGPTTQLNWRCLDLNLLLSELKMHSFGTVEWYDDISTNGTRKARYGLRTVSMNFSNLSPRNQIRVLEKSVIEHGDMVLDSALNDVAMEKESQGNISAAMENYERALGLDPHGIWLIYNYADLLAKTSMLPKARKLLSRLLLLCPENARAWGLQGMVTEYLGDINTAVRSYGQRILLITRRQHDSVITPCV
jgi:tetratricopeptide (TPR) repeat protein